MRLYRLIIFSLLIGFASCSSDSSPYKGSDRTLVVYLAMDDGGFLSYMAPSVVELLRDSWRRDYDGNLLIYADNGGECCLVHVRKEGEGVIADTVKFYDDHNSADPEVFRRVLVEIEEGWPARSYGLIVSTHGTGWLPKTMMAAPRTIINDRSSGGMEMEIKDFAEALPFYLDFLIFDACLMGAVEVAYELRHKAEYILASPAEMLAEGMITLGTTDHLMKSKPDLRAVAKDFFDFYDKQEGSYRSATVGLIKTAELEQLAEISYELLNDIDVEEQIDINRVQVYGYGANKLYFDMGDLVEQLEPYRYEEFKRILDRVVIYKAHTPGYYSSGGGYSNIESYCGLSIYIPQSRFPELNESHGKTQWGKRVSYTGGGIASVE